MTRRGLDTAARGKTNSTGNTFCQACRGSVRMGEHALYGTLLGNVPGIQFATEDQKGIQVCAGSGKKIKAPAPVVYACLQLRTGPVSMCTYLDRG